MEHPPHLLPALLLLLQAHEYADELRRDAWDFALEITVLQQQGLTANDLRWLVYKGYLRCASEATGVEGSGLSHAPVGRLLLSESCCFFLTEEGVAFACGALASWDGCPATPPPTVSAVPALDSGVPSWDKDRRELRFGARLIKQFKVPAPNQEIILASFQEEGWPVRIDDPLPYHAAIDPRRRLHDTICSLNRNQRVPLLRFQGDGSGQAICWEPGRDEPHPAANGRHAPSCSVGRTS